MDTLDTFGKFSRTRPGVIAPATIIPNSPFSHFLSTFEPVYITGVKTLCLLAHSVPPLDRPFTNFLTAMTALEGFYISTSGLVYSINLLDDVDQHWPFLYLKRLIRGPDLAEFPDSTSFIVNFLATRRKIGMSSKYLTSPIGR